MDKKIKQEEIAKIYLKQDYELISEYKGSLKLLYVKDKEGYICSSYLNGFKNGNLPFKFHKNNPYTIQNIKLWIKTNAIGYELLSTKYIKATEKLLFRCPNKHMFEMSWNGFKNGNRCHYCSNKKIKLGVNTIWDTDRWMCDLGISEEDAKKYSYGSENKITVECPHCGKEKKTTPNKIYTRKSIQCSCEDGISYPEKFIISVFNQLNVKYQHDSYWIKNKRYDFFLNNYNIIVECHGGQHYNESGFKTCKGRTLQEEQQNDKYKEKLALNNGINNYIVLDCRNSDLEFIKNSVLNSELNNIFELNRINWLKCEEFALSNRVKEVCDYWNNKEEWETTTTIGKKFNLDRHTICNYLKKGKALNWCNLYNPNEELKRNCSKVGKSLSKPVKILKDGVILGLFESCLELERQSEKLFNTKLFQSNISAVCRGEMPQYKGFQFKYVEDGDNIASK